MGGIYLSVGIKVETNSNFFLVCLHNLVKEVELCGNVKSFFSSFLNIEIVKQEFCLEIMLHLFSLPSFWVDGSF